MFSRLLSAPPLRSPYLGLFTAARPQTRLLSATPAHLKRSRQANESAASKGSSQDEDPTQAKASEGSEDNDDSTSPKPIPAKKKTLTKAKKQQLVSEQELEETDAISLIANLTDRLSKLEKAQSTKKAAAKPKRALEAKKTPTVRRIKSKGNATTPPTAGQTLLEAMQGSSLKAMAVEEVDDEFQKATQREDQWRKKVTDKSLQTLSANDLDFQPIHVEIPPIPRLAHGLDRVLFNPSLYRLQDPRSRVYNFDPYLEKIMPVKDFDFSVLSAYTTSSKDEKLLAITRQSGVKFTGSTSSMAGVLQHFHYLLSDWRNLNHMALSRQFMRPAKSFTKITVGPQAIFLRWKDGVYAVDADKSFDSPNVMSWLGNSMEKLLTSTREEFERYRRSNPEQPPSEAESGKSYHYSKLGNFLVRSQLDAQDTRLPGTGVFDLKTRAVLPVRMNSSEHEKGAGYQLRYSQGEYESFEREDYDMSRATMLKYMLQVRMGRMDGIFVAYHNVERIFGFRYFSLPDLDFIIHGQTDTSLGDKEFKMSVGLLDEILQRATAKFPETSIRLHFETGLGTYPPMSIFAEPVTEEQIEEVQNSKAEIVRDFERKHVYGEEEVVEEKVVEEKDVEEKVEEERVEEEKVVEEKDVDDKDVEEKSVEGKDVDQRGIAEKDLTQNDVEENGKTKSEEETIATSSTGATKNPLPKHNGSAARVKPPTSGPLMGWTLIARNIVNGEGVTRPENIGPSDDYSIEYIIEDIAENTAPVLYKSLKERRKALFDKNPDDDQTLLDNYRARIHEYTLKGRDWRIEQDKIDEELGQRVFRPLGPGSMEMVKEREPTGAAQ